MRLAPLPVVLVSVALAACDAPGRRAADQVWIAPAEVADFSRLYARNCSGCHGADGRGGASTDLRDPVYLAIADDATIRRITAQGVPGTAMPAFAQQSGGELTDAQIEILVSGMRSRWGKPGMLAQANPPPYAADEPGRSQTGRSRLPRFLFLLPRREWARRAEGGLGRR